MTTLFHGVSFHLAHPITVQVKGVTFASKRNFYLSGHGLGIYIFQKFAVKFPAHEQIIPVKCNQIPPPRAAHCSVKYLKAGPRKGTIKISPNKTLQSLFINVAASPKIHVPVTSAIICFDQSIRVTLHRIQKPLQESPHFVRLSITVLSKGYKESQFYNLTVIVANEPYTNQLYLQKSTWFLFTSVYFDTTVS